MLHLWGMLLHQAESGLLQYTKVPAARVLLDLLLERTHSALLMCC